MVKRNTDNKNQERRRIVSMLKRLAIGINLLVVLAFISVMPVKAQAGVFPVMDTDFPFNFQLVYFWDQRGRDTFFQLTNQAPVPIAVHIQVFNASLANCEETDFIDLLSANDTNIYNMRNLSSNCNLADNHSPGNIDCKFFAPDFVNSGLAPQGDIFGDTGFGYIVVSSLTSSSIIGNFRVLDTKGYEYRTNAVATNTNFPPTFGWSFNFNDVNKNKLSDVIGIPIGDADSDTVEPGVAITFNTLGFDDQEAPLSCSPVTFGCGRGDVGAVTDSGINQALPNSKDGSRICNGSAKRGYIGLEEIDCSESETGEVCDSDEAFVGFIGLNNGDHTGTMDSWTSFAEFLIPLSTTPALKGQ